MFRDDQLNTNASMFQAQLIWMSGPQRDPIIRMLLAAKADDGSVYEGIASWSKYHAWLGSFLDATAAGHALDNLKQILGRNKYAVLSDLTISFDDLDSYGFQRVDR